MRVCPTPRPLGPGCAGFVVDRTTFVRLRGRGDPWGCDRWCDATVSGDELIMTSDSKSSQVPRGIICLLCFENRQTVKSVNENRGASPRRGKGQTPRSATLREAVRWIALISIYECTSTHLSSPQSFSTYDRSSELGTSTDLVPISRAGGRRGLKTWNEATTQ